MGDWDYSVKGFAGAKHHNRAPFGSLLVHTTHVGFGSMQVETEVWKDRMRRGEVSRVEVVDLNTGRMVVIEDPNRPVLQPSDFREQERSE